jgi:deoxycytidylate deaminase
MDVQRRRVNVGKIKEGRMTVLSQLNTVGSRCNGSMDKTLPKAVVVDSDSGDGEISYMECKAKIWEGSDDPVAEGVYNSAYSIHAEMDALADYITQETDFLTIDRIEITAPPCKSCAFVLELLGVINKVKTTKGIYKHATSAWKWNPRLLDPDSFEQGRWTTIKNYFKDSGLSEQEILDEVVKIVESQSVN